MAEKLDVRLTLQTVGKVMGVMTTDGVIDMFGESSQTFTGGSAVENILDDEIRFECTISDNFEIDTVTNTNEHFKVKCITDSSFVYTWADPTFRTDIIDTITITTRYKEDTPEIGPNSNLNIDTLANTTWDLTLYPEEVYICLISIDDLSSYASTSFISLNCK
jgi:hypothetical protein